MKILLIIILFLTAGRLGAEPIRVATSIFPVADIIRQIADGNEHVQTVIPPFADPHDFEPKPSEIVHLNSARVFFGVNPHFDGWIVKFLPLHCKVIFLSEPEQTNEHIWLDTKGGERMARKIADTLKQLDPAHATEYEKRFLAFQQSLANVHQQAAQVLQNLKTRTFIQYHPAWNTFANEFNLSIQTTIASGHGKEPSPRQLLDLIRDARRLHVHVVVIGLHVENKTAITLAHEINGKLVRLDTLGNPGDPSRNTYQKILLFNAHKLAEALNE